MATSTPYASDQAQVSRNEGQADAEHSRSRAIEGPPDSFKMLLSYMFTLKTIQYRNMQDQEVVQKWQEELVKIGESCNAKLREEFKKAQSVEGGITRLRSVETTEQRLDLIHSSLAQCRTLMSEQPAEHPSSTSHPSFGELCTFLSTLNKSLTRVRRQLSSVKRDIYRLTQDISDLGKAIEKFELEDTFKLNPTESKRLRETLNSAVAEVAEGNPDKYSECKDILRTISNAWIMHYNIRAEDATRDKLEKLSTLLKKLCVVQSLALIVANVSHKLNLGEQKPEAEVSHVFLRRNEVWKPMMPNFEELWQYIAGS